ncbi:MAG TPA: LuxR C-terminal-related transcriptional regulator [Trebonia sp.]
MVTTLHGRASESAIIDEVIADAGAGRSRALVLRGPAGIGKTALLEYAAMAGAAAGLRVLRCAGVESEAELAFAALHQLLPPRLIDFQVLPGPQSAALRGALGLDSDAPGGDQFMVGLAVLSALSDLAEGHGAVCLIDDLHWADRPSAESMLFVARHAEAEGIALLFASRDEDDAAGLPELALSGLDDDASRALLAESAPGLDAWQRDRVLRESHGMPLALRELPKAEGGEDQLLLPLPARLQEFYSARMAELPAPTKSVLLLAATDVVGDLGTISVAAAAAGIDAPAALQPAERAHLVTVERLTVAFRHPLARTAVYRGASFAERAAAHQALAAVLASTEQADMRAWHLAAAADRPDERVAAELELTADRARRRRGYWAAAAALEQAARLSADDPARARRLSLAAVAARDAGHLDTAASLASRAEALDPDLDSQIGLADLRAGVGRARGDFRGSHRHYLRATSLLAPKTPAAAAAMAVNALRVAWWMADDELVAEAVSCLSDLAKAAPGDLASALTGAQALAALHDGRPGAAVALLRSVLAAEDASPAGQPDMRVHLATLATLAGQVEISHDLLRTADEDCRRHGVIRLLPQIHLDLASTELMLNHLQAAQATASSGLRIAQDMGQLSCVAGIRGVLAVLSALRGDEGQTARLAQLVLHDAGFPPSGAIWACARWALAVLDLGAGRLETCLEQLQAITSSPVRRCPHITYFPIAADHVEAAARLGRPETIQDLLGYLGAWASATGQPWALALSRRCAALADPAADTESEYRAALRLHADAGRRFDHARTSLLFGEWLRRTKRAADARPVLRDALVTFETSGLAPWAARARSELRASGAAPPADGQAEPGRLSLLTPQELQVARLAASGATNREIASQLFLSPKTVSHHLYRAFPKLGVATRTALAHLDLSGG